MKKTICYILITVLLLLLIGCTKNNQAVVETPLTTPADETETKLLSEYIGKWYATTIDEEHNFDVINRFVSNAEEDVFYIWGLEIEIVEMESGYYAYLSTCLNPSKHAFIQQKKNGDPLLSMTQTASDTWQISFDETDGYEIIGAATLTLKVNAAGKLYVEISGSNPCPNTPLYALDEWQNGNYKYYDFDKSVDIFGTDIMGTYSPVDCEHFLINTFYKKWMSDGEIYDGCRDIYVVSYSSDSYRSLQEELYYYETDDLGTLHHAVFYDGLGEEMSLDGVTYYSELRPESDESIYSEPDTFTWNGTIGEWITDSEILSKFSTKANDYVASSTMAAYRVETMFGELSLEIAGTYAEAPLSRTPTGVTMGGYYWSGEPVFLYREDVTFDGENWITIVWQVTMESDINGNFTYDTFYLRTNDGIEIDYFNPETQKTEFYEWSSKDGLWWDVESSQFGFRASW